MAGTDTGFYFWALDMSDIETAFEEFASNYLDGRHYKNRIAWDMFQAGFKAATQWVDVNERLPEVGEWVLVGRSEGATAVMTAMFIGNDFFTGNQVFKSPTHWRPLPEPPVPESVDNE